jgi:multisubunit Na+/H+ antiporter MnhG subunit
MHRCSEADTLGLMFLLLSVFSVLLYLADRMILGLVVGALLGFLGVLLLTVLHD